MVRRDHGGTPASNMSTVLCRLVAVALIGLVWLFQHEADDRLNEMWQVLRASWWFQHESFEVKPN